MTGLYPPMQRAQDAPPPRTLVDIFTETAMNHPDALCIDDGEQQWDYTMTLAKVTTYAHLLNQHGIGPGDTVGIRMTSGRADLYVCILATLFAGAAYVPVDIEDPQERADMVFSSAEVAAICTDDGLLVIADKEPVNSPKVSTGDDAWIIFTSGTTGVPKGVAVNHRNAAAFVDAEAQLFLQGDPLGPQDRILAGLSVAFDASCEEMWLAWRHGSCLVPAPRSLVKSGVELGEWLVEKRISVISTVPTLASMWPDETLANIRMIIVGGEACAPDLAARLASDSCEFWNTYGPTEATVVACAAKLSGVGEVPIGMPLAGWDLAVVDTEGAPVPMGGTGELVIGGVGLARYLDAEKDAEKYAPMPSIGWQRAYRSGDMVRLEPEGLYFAGRVDDQVKIGGRRIELGEVDTALSDIPGVSAAAAAVHKTTAGTAVLVGYLVTAEGVENFDLSAAAGFLREHLPAGVVPRLTVLEQLPTKTSGKVDRTSLPWPLADTGPDRSSFTPTQGWLAEMYSDALGAEVSSPKDDFFALGGGSLAAAIVIGQVRSRYNHITVADLYDRPRVKDFAAFLDEQDTTVTARSRDVTPVSRRAQIAQFMALSVSFGLRGMHLFSWVAVALVGVEMARFMAGSTVQPGMRSILTATILGIIFLLPISRLLIATGIIRLLMLNIQPGVYRRAGWVHGRIWLAESVLSSSGAVNESSMGLMHLLARLLGNNIGRQVDFHSIPPVTGLLTVGDGAAIETEVDVSGYWVNADVVHVGRVTIEEGAVVSSRCTLLPDTVVSAGTVVEAGSAVTKTLKKNRIYSGSPARKVGKRGTSWPQERPAHRWYFSLLYGVSAVSMAGIGLISLAVGLAAGFASASWLTHLFSPGHSSAVDLGEFYRQFLSGSSRALAWMLVAAPIGAVVAMAVFAVITVMLVRVLAIRLKPGYHPIHSRVAWQAWCTERLMDQSRTYLFPLYASMLTPVWLRILGATIGKDVEASTVLLIPSLTTVKDGAFLADDTMVASYELGNGWMKVGPAQVGKRAFLGNSGMAGAGRKIPKHSLVAVLSRAPEKSKAGSSWIGSPPRKLPRASLDDADAVRTFTPSVRLKIARGVVETGRLIPVMASFALLCSVVWACAAVFTEWGVVAAALAGGPILLCAGIMSVALSVIAKWACVGHIDSGEKPLWSSFVWRNELADTFVESVAAPWMLNHCSGTVVLPMSLRLLGAKVGRGSWMESYWLPEADLASIGIGCTVNRGCVVQTHLFHDRIMQLDRVEIHRGATLGPHCVSLPASSIGAGSTIGPASLVMRGDKIPAGTHWQGNPIAPSDVGVPTDVVHSLTSARN